MRLAAAGEPGIRARIHRALYQGGYFKVEAVPDAATDLRLVVHAPESMHPVEGAEISIAIDDGWVIPRAAESGP